MLVTPCAAPFQLSALAWPLPQQSSKMGGESEVYASLAIRDGVGGSIARVAKALGAREGRVDLNKCYKIEHTQI